VTTKLLHLITRLDTGGSAENAVITSTCLDKNKYDVLLVFGQSEAKTPKNFPFRFIELPNLVRNISPLSDISAFICLYKLFKKEKPGILHTHSSKAGFIGRWAGWLAGVPRIIHTPHGHVFYGYEFGSIKAAFFLWLERLSALITYKLIALTDGERQESLACGVGKDSQWTVVHSGVDTHVCLPCGNNEARKAMGIPADALVIGTVARLEPVKGVRYLIESFPTVMAAGSHNVHLVIAGDGQERKMLEALAKKLNISNKITFLGMRSDINKVMSTMDIYVQPSLNEGMGKTIIQAQASGLPVVATRVQGIPNAVKENETAILVAPGDSQSLARGILALVSVPETRACYGKRAKEWVNEEAEPGFERFCSPYMIALQERIYDTANKR
jgi:glycosyltransferase involved in cell wall biosynthesis